ncbi:MAG: hypothetical protein EOP10_02995 [Proteobacteria bacterium]|nr:MAG: hypothetical protein EOP10_02995 [Pseudomonadota bacterium]
MSENSVITSLSEQVWNFRWADYMPFHLTENIIVTHAKYDEAIGIIKKIFPEIFRTNEAKNNFSDQDSPEFKSSYYRLCGDFFIFRDQTTDEIAGMAVCALHDWGGLNFRTIAMRPQYQSQGLYPLFTEFLASVLKDVGVSRIEGDVSGSNRQHLNILTKMGYVITGHSASGSFGLTVRITKFLRENDEARFADLFSCTSASDQHSNAKFQPKKTIQFKGLNEQAF